MKKSFFCRVFVCGLWLLLSTQTWAGSTIPRHLRDNPLLKADFKLSDVRLKHFLPAWDYFESIAQADLQQFIEEVRVMSRPSMLYAASQEAAEEQQREILQKKFKKLVFLENFDADLTKVQTVLSWRAMAFGSKPLNKIRTAISKKSQDFSAKIFQNRTIFDFVDHLYRMKNYAIHQNKNYFNGFEQESLIDIYYESFAARGIHLSKDQQEQLNDALTELRSVERAYSMNQLESENENRLLFDLSELPGVPKSILDALDTRSFDEETGKLIVPPESTISGIIAKYCTDESIRKKIYESNLNIGAFPEKFSNIKLVQRNVNLRYKIANLQGFESPAAATFHPNNTRLAGSLENLKDIFAQWERAYLPHAKVEYDQFRSRYPEVIGKPWNRHFYGRIQTEEDFGLDLEKVTAYFEWNRVSQHILDRFGNLLGLKFVKVPPKERLFFHPDFFEWYVLDTQNNDKLISTLFVDAFERKGKAPGAHKSVLLSPFGKNIKNRRSVLKMHLNFPPPDKIGVALMPLHAISTFAHELGHSIHQIVSRARYVSQFGTSVPRDVVEIPSMLSERFVESADFIKDVARHYRTNAPMPYEWIAQINKYNQSGAASFMRVQMSVGLMDLGWFAKATPPPDKAFENLETFLAYTNSFSQNLDFDGKPVWGQAPLNLSIQHFFGAGAGYVVGYYGYPFSKMYRAAVFERFLEAPYGPWDQEVGLEWRKNVLSIGSSKSIRHALENFLGGPVTIGPMLKEDGLACGEITTMVDQGKTLESGVL